MRFGVSQPWIGRSWMASRLRGSLDGTRIGWPGCSATQHAGDDPELGDRALGTTHDIADAVAFLFGPDSTFVTGTDLLVGGGVVASIRTGAAVSARRTG
ncbi:hypothetical protein ACU61A_12685 [Pseudonocardia sichuanensis]